MKELSVFVDESGDFGEYAPHAPFYIITMIFHDQNAKIAENIALLEFSLAHLGYENHCVHVGPLIRKESDYAFADLGERRKILNKMVSFVRASEIAYKCFVIEKKQIADAVDASGKLARQIAAFIRSREAFFEKFDVVKIYYDNGQVEVTKILSSVFNALLPNVVFKKVIPSNFRLFQVADLICSFKLISLKLEHDLLSRSELRFFGNIRDLKKNYLKPLKRKEFEN